MLQPLRVSPAGRVHIADREAVSQTVIAYSPLDCYLEDHVTSEEVPH